MTAAGRSFTGHRWGRQYASGMPLVRPASPADVVAIARIYGAAVHTSVATFDLTDPPNIYWERKIASDECGDHVLVIEDGTGVVGFAYSAAFRPRPAYAQTRETSVYVAPEAVGVGLGSLIYLQLLSLLREDGMHLAVAVIAQPNPASVALHEKLGFELVGTLQEVGRKFDRWVDTGWYQLPLER
jgi:L-amino acid N-acyltransferase YncA